MWQDGNTTLDRAGCLAVRCVLNLLSGASRWRGIVVVHGVVALVIIVGVVLLVLLKARRGIRSITKTLSMAELRLPVVTVATLNIVVPSVPSFLSTGKTGIRQKKTCVGLSEIRWSNLVFAREY
jgi:hypothetical protein